MLVHPPSRLRLAALAALVLLFAFAGPAAAHAEFVESSPADGDTVEGTPPAITADFSETVADGSTIELLDAAGQVVAEGRIHEFYDTRMIIEPEPLEPGDYEVRWQAIAADGHIERGTYGFTVTAAPTPPPSPTAAATAAPSEPVAPSAPPVSAAPSPTGGGDPEPAAGSGDVLIPILAAVVLVAVLGGYLLTRRRSTPRP